MSFPITFTASVETEEFNSFQYPYHLGTIETVARRCVKDIFHNRFQNSFPVLTVALKFDGHIIDVWDGGCWSNDSLEKAAAEMVGEWA